MSESLLFSQIQQPIYYVSALVKYMQAQGVELNMLLEGTGLTQEKATALQGFITNEQYRFLILNATRLSKDRAFALKFGKSLAPTAHGMLGLGALSSATVGQALELAIKFTKTRTPLYRSSLTKCDGKAFVRFEEVSNLGDVRNFVAESFVGSYLSFSLYVLQGKLPGGRLSFNFPEPEYLDEFKKILPSTVELEFDAPCIEFTFDEKVLDRQLGLPNSESVKLAETECEQMLSEMEQQGLNVVERVRLLLQRSLPKVLVLDDVAAMIYVSPRTLRRQLNAEGQGYKAIVDDVRRAQAIEMLERRQTIAEVAYQLGYNDPSNFCRAFKKWTGKAPSVFAAEISGR